ncbi:MAG TPA: hypothetical protein VKN99_05505 [Polyangia bacterium]|nr:hypothetical protein [Polyangia bacterium]
MKRTVRRRGLDEPTKGGDPEYHGFLIGHPQIGRPMVIFREDDRRHILTSPVQRVLGDVDGNTLRVETMNSVYVLHAPPTRP